MSPGNRFFDKLIDKFNKDLEEDRMCKGGYVVKTINEVLEEKEEKGEHKTWDEIRGSPHTMWHGTPSVAHTAEAASKTNGPLSGSPIGIFSIFKRKQ